MNKSHTQGEYTARHEKNSHSRLSTFKKITVLTVVGLLASASVMSAASVSRVAYITDGDQTYTVTTVDTDTCDIVEEAGLELSYYDKAIVTEESSERIDINILRAFSVKISADGGTRSVKVTDGTVADVLNTAGIETSANDFITPALNTELEEDMIINVVRGVKVYLTCDGATNIIYVPEGKVGDALAYMGYQLCEDDDVSVDLNSEVEEGMKINVDRVEYKTVYEKETITHTVIEEASDEIPLGETKVKQEGKDGVLEITIKEKYVNGELVSSEKESTQVLRKAVDEIILVGTKEEASVSTDIYNNNETTTTSNEIFAEFSPRTNSSSDISANDAASSSLGTITDLSGNMISYSAVITGSCTAYTEPGGITATGTVPRVGTVAVNPNVIPYGSRLYICSADGSYVYGYAVAEDTGGACMAGDIVADLYMDSLEACSAFGRQNLCVYVLS